MKYNIGYKLLTPIMRVIFKIYYNPQIINKNYIPKKGSIIIACNHKHLFDQCLTIMATKRSINYMAKKEYFEGRLAWFFKLVGCIPVDRTKKDVNAKNKALTILKKNGAIGIFPEGTRNRNKKRLLLDFKYGAVSMAKKADSLIVPCAVTGDYKFRSNSLTVRYGKPFKVKNDLKDENIKLQKKIEELIKISLDETKRTLEEELETHEV